MTNKFKIEDLTKSCTFINGVAYIPLHIENVIFNNPATIVFWSDGSKTIVKCKDEAFDEEKGLAMAISKKVLGNKGNYFNEFKKWLPEIEVYEDIIDAFNAVPGVYPVSPEELKDILDKGDEK